MSIDEIFTKVYHKFHIYNLLYRISPYLLISFGYIFSSFFDSIIAFPLLIILFIIFIILIKKFKQFMKNSIILLLTEAIKTKEELKKKIKTDNGAEEFKSTRTTEQVIQQIYDYTHYPYHTTAMSKYWIETIIKDEKNQKLNLFYKIQEKFFRDTDVLQKVLIEFLDNEYYELTKFLTLKKEKNYLVWIVFEIFVFTIIYILSVLAYFFLEIKFFLYLNNIFILLFFEMKYILNKKFNSGRYRHKKNKKLLIEFQEILNLIFNNSNIQSLDKYSKYEVKFKKFNKSVNDYNNAVKPFIYHIKKFEVLAILALLISIILPIMDIQLTISFISNNLIDIIISFILLFPILITPAIQDWKRQEINKFHIQLRKKVDTLITDMKSSQLIFNIYSNLREEII